MEGCVPYRNKKYTYGSGLFIVRFARFFSIGKLQGLFTEFERTGIKTGQR